MCADLKLSGGNVGMQVFFVDYENKGCKGKLESQQILNA